MFDWGFSEDIAVLAHTTGSRIQEQTVSTAAAILPAGSYFRCGVYTSQAATANAFDQSVHDFDQMMYTLAKYGLTPVVNFHIGSAPYNVPTRDGSGAMTNFYNWIKSALATYSPSGSFTNGSTVSVYGSSQTVSGYTAPTRFEVWNEPNSPTGHGDGTLVNGQMAPADAYDILYYASKALREY